MRRIQSFELTGFQRDLLYVIAGSGRPSGEAVRREMETYIDGVNHGRIYPNLNKLVDYSLVTKGSLDQRTNYYEITDRGKALLSHRRRWENQYISLPQVLVIAVLAISTQTGIPFENGFLSKIGRFL